MKTLDEIERDPKFNAIACEAIKHNAPLIAGVQIQGEEFSFNVVTLDMFEEVVAEEEAIAAHEEGLRSRLGELEGEELLVALISSDFTSIEMKSYNKMFFIAAADLPGPESIFGITGLLRHHRILEAIADLLDLEGPQFLAVMAMNEGIATIKASVKEAMEVYAQASEKDPKSKQFSEALSSLSGESVMIASFVRSDMEWTVIQKDEYKTGPQWEAREKRLRRQKRNLENLKRQQEGSNDRE